MRRKKKVKKFVRGVIRKYKITRNTKEKAERNRRS